MPGRILVRSTDHPVHRRAGAFEFGRGNEGDRHCFRQSRADERVCHQTTFTLRLREPADLLFWPRHGPTDGSEADAPSDLFDDVDLALEVGTEGWRDCNDVVARARDLDAQRTERVEDLAIGEARPEHPVHLARADPDP